MSATVKKERTRLTAWDLTAIEFALKAYARDHGASDSLARLIAAVERSDSGTLVRRIATVTGQDR